MSGYPNQPVKNILAETINYLENQTGIIGDKKLPRKMSPHRGHYASQQSIVVGDKRYGSCPRQVYYDRVHPELAIREEHEDPLTVMGIFGEVINDVIVDMTRKLGVYIRHEYEYAQEEGYWSGRSDIICYYWRFNEDELFIDKNRIVIVENKTVAGFHGCKPCIWPDGGIYEPKKPEAVMQNSLYIDKMIREGFPVAEGRLFYMARDTGLTGTHYVNIQYDEPSDERRIYVNGLWYKGFTIEGINKESEKLNKAVLTQQIPERAFQQQYPQKKMIKLLQADELNEKDKASMKKDKITLKGDTACTYCKFAHKCWEGISTLEQWNDEDNTLIEHLGG